MIVRPFLVVFLLLGCFASAACGGGGNAGDGASKGDVFLAFAADFKGFRKWMRFDVYIDEVEGGDAGAPHPEKHLIEYVNKLPPHGASEFPLRTIIVKEGQDPDQINTYFAMVKRGGGYNKTGPVGWEWFELTDAGADDNSVRIVWRGVGPPAGEMYGGDPNGGCNQCHTPDQNDSVLAEALKLENF